MSRERLTTLLSEAAALLPDCELSDDAQGRAWALSVGDQALLFVQHQPELGRIVISAEVAPLPQSGAATLRSRLLTFNSSPQDSGGLWMSLDGATGAVMQSVDLVLEGLTPDRLTATCEAFLRRLKGWRQSFAEVERAAAEPFFSGARGRILTSGGNEPTLVPGPLRV